MALTTYEAVKVVGMTLEDVGAKGEEFEDAHPGESYKPSVGDIVKYVTDTLTNMGKEVLD